jgi:ABC-type glycerol-3-phosphate transport system substrate-binding protein
MIRRSISFVAILAAFATPALAADPIILKFWDNQQTESGLSQYQKEAVKRFEAQNPDIKIEVTTIPYPEFQQRLLTAVQGGNAPDVSTVDQIWVAAFADAGAIKPLDSEAKAAGVTPQTFFKGAWDSANYKGKLWGIPFNVDVWQFAYVNNALFKDAGVDPQSIKTFAGLKAAAEKLTDPAKGRYGVGLFAHKGEDTVVVMDSFIFSNGGKVLNDDGSCGLTSPASVGALDYLQSLVPYAPKGATNSGSGEMRELFLNGSLAIEYWPALEQPTLQKSKVDWDSIVASAPDGKTPIGTYGGWNLVVYQTSKHQEAAWKFIQFLIREDVNGSVVDLVPANVNAAKAFLAANRKEPDQIMAHLANAAPRPLSPHYLEVADIEIKMAQDLFGGTKAKDAAQKACDAINAIK